MVVVHREISFQSLEFSLGFDRCIENMWLLDYQAFNIFVLCKMRYPSSATLQSLAMSEGLASHQLPT